MALAASTFAPQQVSVIPARVQADHEEPSYEDLTAIDLYVKETEGYKRLSAAEEIELSRRIRAGDRAAEVRLIEANLRLVMSVARDYKSAGMDIDDLVQEGNIGLMKAVTRYDGEKGFRFSTYAVWWIRQQITRAIWANHGPLKVPTRLIDAYKREEKARRAKGEVQEQERPAPWHVVAVSGAEADDHFAAIPASDQDNPPTIVEERNILAMVAEILGPVNRRDRQIAGELFGLGGDEPLSLQEVAERHDLTVERVRQIKRGLVDRLRNSSLRDQLAASA